MPVQYFEWGKIAGGSSSGGGAVISNDADYGPEESFSGTLGAATVTETFSNSTKKVSVYNTHNTEYMEISFDGGTDWIPVDPNGHREEAVSVTSVQLRRTGAGNPTYTVVAVLMS